MGTTISNLPVASAIAGANLLPVVQSSITNKATITQLFTSPALVTPDLGTPTALVGTNITGTATAFNINGTVGATTPAAGTFTQVNASNMRVNPTSTIPAGGSTTQALNFSSTANFGIFYGSGVPSASLYAAQGSLYLRTDGSSTSTRMYINTNGVTSGTATWTAVTTAA